MTEGGQDILNATYGPRWKLHRKLASKVIRQYLTGDGFGKKVSETLNITTELMKKETGPFDPVPYLSLAIFNILYGMCFNKLSPNTNDENFIAPLRLFPTKRFRDCMELAITLNDAMRKELREHRETFQTGVTRDFTDSLILAQKEAENEEDPVLLSQITDTNIMLTVSNVFLAGLDTSKNALNWALLAMALYPDIQEKIQEEVDTVIDADLTVRLSDRVKLPYTEAVLYEIMRFRPVVPTGVPHEALRNTTVGGYEFPKGTVVLVNHYSLHFDPDQWDDVKRFNPERFLDSSGKMAPKPESWLPFSAGRRVCLGESLAKPELHLILAGIMRAFAESLAPGETNNFEPPKKSAQIVPEKYRIVVQSRI